MPVLVLANKQDLPNAAHEGEISQCLGLDLIKTRQWSIHKTSAVTGQGIEDSMNWLVDTLNNAKK